MNRYALIVGIGQYTSARLATLERARADAQAMHDLLNKHGDFQEIHLLQDEQASCEQLIEKLEYVLLEQGDKVSARDGAVLFWPGGGEAAAVGAVAEVELCGGAGAFG